MNPSTLDLEIETISRNGKAYTRAVSAWDGSAVYWINGRKLDEDSEPDSSCDCGDCIAFRQM
jgi:hypothetical protein